MVHCAMVDHEVVPDVLQCTPCTQLSVEYQGKLLVRPGMVLTPTQVKEAPLIRWPAETYAYYTVCMTDPDAPSREKPKYREWHHWLVGNVPGCCVAKGDLLSAYIGAGPPKGTGLHRYVLLVYKQERKLDFKEPRLTNTNADGRGGFKIAKFAEKYGLGEPVAGNFFQAEFDSWVPKLYKQLGA